jgi:hypothetical protein
MSPSSPMAGRPVIARIISHCVRGEARKTEIKMEDHKFAVGQTVQFTPGALDRAAPRGTYTIVRLLPPAARVNQYRIKSTADGHERVVQEVQLDR